MSKTEKKINKWIIGLVLGGAVVGGMSATKKGRSFWGRTSRALFRPLKFFGRGLREMRKEMEKMDK